MFHQIPLSNWYSRPPFALWFAVFIDEANEGERSAAYLNNHGEIKREEMMIFGKDAMKDHEPIRLWLFQHINRLAATTCKGPLINVDSIAGLIECGRHRAISELIPKMDVHLASIDAKKILLELADQGDKTALYKCFLDTFTLDYLKPFGTSLGLKDLKSKASMINSIATASSIEQFNHFIISNELRTKEQCIAYQACAKRAVIQLKQTPKRKYEDNIITDNESSTGKIMVWATNLNRETAMWYYFARCNPIIKI